MKDLSLTEALESVNFEPSGDRVLVRPPRQMDRIGKIFVPDTVKKELPSYGVIVDVGPGMKDENGTLHPVQYHAGQVVWFGRHAGYAISVEDEEFLILREIDIFGTSKVIED